MTKIKLIKKLKFILRALFILLLPFFFNSCLLILGTKSSRHFYNFINTYKYDEVKNITTFKIQRNYFFELSGKWKDTYWAPHLVDGYLNTQDSSTFEININNWYLPSRGGDSSIVNYLKWLHKKGNKTNPYYFQNIYDLDTVNNTIFIKATTSKEEIYEFAGLKGDKLVQLQICQKINNSDKSDLIKNLYKKLSSLITDNRTYQEVLIDRKRRDTLPIETTFFHKKPDLNNIIIQDY